MKPNTAMDRMLKSREVAHRLDCDEGTVYNLIKEKRLRAVRLGRVWRIPESSLDELIASAGTDDDGVA